MKKMNRLPHEQSVPDTDASVASNHDGRSVADSDVEGHRAGFLPGMPGTGGDSLRRPISGGEVDGDDVEGHALGHTKGERFLPGMPGTGGDVKVKIAVDVEDDVEGHRL
jgi:hypothetical protein